jgi:hypothetical protein
VDDYYQVFVNRYRSMDYAITDPTLEQFDSGATTDLASTRSRDQVSLAAGMSAPGPGVPETLIVRRAMQIRAPASPSISMLLRSQCLSSCRDA